MRAEAPRVSTRAADAGPRVTRRALRDSVHDVVLEGILDGTHMPGSTLGIDQLARNLGVSPTPVREALAQMEHTGLVTRAALKGYRVAPLIDDDQMAELIAARSVIELAAVREVVARGVDVLAELRVAHAHHTLAAHRLHELRSGGGRPTDHDDLRTYFAADRDFHLVILRAAGNRYLLQVAESLDSHVHRMRQTLDREDFDAHDAVAEHSAVLAAFDSGDPEAPTQAMAAHLRGVARRSTRTS